VQTVKECDPASVTGQAATMLNSSAAVWLQKKEKKLLLLKVECNLAVRAGQYNPKKSPAITGR